MCRFRLILFTGIHDSYSHMNNLTFNIKCPLTGILGQISCRLHVSKSPRGNRKAKNGVEVEPGDTALLSCTTSLSWQSPYCLSAMARGSHASFVPMPDKDWPIKHHPTKAEWAFNTNSYSFQVNVSYPMSRTSIRFSRCNAVPCPNARVIQSRCSTCVRFISGSGVAPMAQQ